VTTGREYFIRVAGTESAIHGLGLTNKNNGAEPWGIAPHRRGAQISMPVYRFRILDKFGRVIAGQYIQCTDDDAARRHADILAAVSRKPGIEIWNRDQPVARDAPDESRIRLHNCPQCGCPDVSVVRWPAATCLACGCAYEFGELLEGCPQPSGSGTGVEKR